MAIRKIVSRSIGTDVIAAEDLANNSVTVAEIQDGAVTSAKINGLTHSSTGILHSDGDGTVSITTADLVDDTTPQLGGNLDLNGNNINDGTLLIDDSRIRFPNASSDPSSPNDGDMYYNTSDDAWRGYSSTQGSWRRVSSAAPYSVDFLVIASGGSGGAHAGSGGGAGGYRASYNSETSGGGATSETALLFEPDVVYTIQVGGGAAGVVNASGTQGNNSFISGSGLTTITSLGGGKGVGGVAQRAGFSGGSGSGGAASSGTLSPAGGAGTAGQGYAGGANNANWATGGGGGAGSVGANGSGSNAGNGGSGQASTITGSSVTRAGGGGGSAQTGSNGSGGSGGGGAGSGSNGGAGTANTGSGGGGSHGSTVTSGAGGSGIVILRMPTAKYTGTTTGSPTVTTSGSDTILTFNSSGTYTA